MLFKHRMNHLTWMILRVRIKPNKKGVLKMLTTYKAVAKSLQDGLQVETKSRTFKIIQDEPKSFGGTDIGMSPVETLLCALGACQAIVANAFAKAHGINLEGFRVELEGDIDLDGFRGKKGIRPGFQSIRYKMHFKTNDSADKIEKFAEFIERTCPVGDSLENGVKLVNAGVIIED